MEYAMQMGPMLILGALTIGLLAEGGWRPGGYGLVNDLMTALAGSLVVGATAWLVASVAPGMIAMVVIGGVGGALAITGQRILWRAPVSIGAGRPR